MSISVIDDPVRGDKELLLLSPKSNGLGRRDFKNKQIYTKQFVCTFIKNLNNLSARNWY